MSTGSTRLSELDALRGLAVTMVVLFHLFMGQTGLLSQLLRVGTTGIDLFFIISGFVIFLTIKKTVKASNFVVGRFVRLYPTYWVCVLLYTGLNLQWGTVHPGKQLSLQLAANLTMLQSYFLQRHIDGVYWTLLVELQFYALMLFLFIRNSLDRIELIGGILTTLALLYGLWLSDYMGVWNMRILRFAELVDFFPLFFSGILYYKLKFEGFTPRRLLLLSLCIIAQISLFHLAPDRVNALTKPVYVSALLVINGLFFLYSVGKLRFIATPQMVFLGLIAYPIYLTHNLVAVLTIRLLTHFSIQLEDWAVISLSAVLCVKVSYLIYCFIEVPIRKRFKPQKHPKSVIA